MRETWLDVLIVHYRHPELTRAAVDSIAVPGIAVWVWDNSGDCPADLRATVHGVGSNVYFARANNELFRLGSAPWVMLMNPDVTVASAIVASLVDRLSNADMCWGATTRLVDSEGRDQNYQHGLPTTAALLADRLPPLRLPLRRYFRRYQCLDLDLTSVTTVAQPAAALLLLSRLTIEGDLLDERFPLFFNDVELAHRLGKAGQRCLYAGDLTATHIGGSSVRAAARSGEPVTAMYAESMRTYARLYLRAPWLVTCAIGLRRVLDQMFGRDW